MDTETVVEFLVKKFGREYSYDRVEYRHSREKISVYCHKHKEFTHKRFDGFVHGQYACVRCGREAAGVAHEIGYDEFVRQARKVHGEIYNYPRDGFSDLHAPVTIICPKHGVFVKNSAHDHTHRKRGCAKCANRVPKTNKEFIEQARFIHGERYNYSLVNYKNNREKVAIICEFHGEFEQTPKTHIKNKAGCPTCAISYSSSVGENRWLDEFQISQENRNIRVNSVYNRRRINVDGFDPDTNNVYLYHGDFWHGNPKFYAPGDLNKRSKKTFGELYSRTLAVEKQLLSDGFGVISIWESDWFEILNSRGEKTPKWY